VRERLHRAIDKTVELHSGQIIMADLHGFKYSGLKAPEIIDALMNEPDDDTD